ncbi:MULTISPECIES: TraE/TraK family type IV conjugative transfer system protein [Methylomonas]|uniref:TraE protein n=2 Tax=Methylomonas TaxID=416 RepID=A0A140E7F5_9GAMM|nr:MULTISPECIES: TraE/TraK family type IV conjugative transfer system protein [Methylomonas]AMK79329.1 TraE protein [Methylomonas denitrificans]OAI03244.1 TraE protein [Methylomonas methanica]TCV86150.1 conjugal transfer pilus assembly protein TraE [Methylomonas methanica]
MKLSDFLQTWDGHETENRFSRVTIIGLLVVCVITSLAAWRTERSIILVPPTLNQEVEVTRTSASSEFKESWGLFLAELLGNTTPANADFLKTAIEPLLAPDIYRSVLDAMTDQIKAIKMDRVAISFTPRHVDYEAETNKVFVSGELKSQGPSSKPDIKPRTYEFIIAIKNYRPRLEFIDVYPDAPRTVERLKALPLQPGESKS